MATSFQDDVGRIIITWPNGSVESLPAPVVRFNEIKSRKFYIVDWNDKRSVEAIFMERTCIPQYCEIYTDIKTRFDILDL